LKGVIDPSESRIPCLKALPNKITNTSSVCDQLIHPVCNLVVIVIKTMAHGTKKNKVVHGKVEPTTTT
jgi:hypothetical protein